MSTQGLRVVVTVAATDRAALREALAALIEREQGRVEQAGHEFRRRVEWEGQDG